MQTAVGTPVSYHDAPPSQPQGATVSGVPTELAPPQQLAQPTENHATGASGYGAVQQRQRNTSTKMSFHALYTKHKTQKRKVWQDGRLVVTASGVSLHAANPAPGGGDPVICGCALLATELQALRQGTLTDLETEKFLVQVEGPWQHHAENRHNNAAASSTQASKAGMQKLLQRKFRKPAAKQPPPPPQSQQLPAALANRKRPLQPGELQQQYYGMSSVRPRSVLQQQQQQLQPPPPPYHNPARDGSAGRAQNPYFPQHPTTALAPRDMPMQPQQPPLPPPLPYNQQPQSLATNNLPTANTGTSTGYHPSPTAIPSRMQEQPCRLVQGPPAERGYPVSNPMGPRPPTTRHQGPPRQEFAANDFDPNGFYGEDGEEEEEEEAEPSMTTQYNGGITSRPRQTTTREEQFVVPPQHPVDPTTEAHPGGTLTTEDLLDLFGGNDSSQQTTVESEIVATATQQVEAPPHDNEPSSENHDILTLPPPSDSSDDEEED